MSSRTTVFIIAAIMIVGVIVGARLMMVEPSEPPPPKAAEQAPPPADLAPEAARALFAERAAVETPASAPATPAEGAYLSVAARFDRLADPASLFLEIFEQPVGVVMLTARFRLADGRTLPEAPLLILARGEDETGLRDVFAADGDGVTVTPRFRATGAGPVSVSLSVSYFAETDMLFQGGLTGEAESLLSGYAASPAPISGGDGHTGVFAERIAPKRVKAVDDLLAIDLPVGDGIPARDVTLKGADGTPLATLHLEVGGYPPLLADASTPYHRLVEMDGLGPVLADEEVTLATLLTGGVEALGPACGLMRQALTERTGLAETDVENVLASLLREHALFAAETDYTQACGTDPGATAADTTADVGKLNAILLEVGGALRWGIEDNAAQLTGRMAERVTLMDRTGLWLAGAEGALLGEGAAAAPDSPAAKAVELLGSLPTEHFACFSAGEGTRGDHRAALLQLRHDPGLYVMDAVFDDQARVIGLALAPAGQREVCRAVGKRKEGEDACYFARTGRTYAGVDLGKC